MGDLQFWDSLTTIAANIIAIGGITFIGFKVTAIVHWQKRSVEVSERAMLAVALGDNSPDVSKDRSALFNLVHLWAESAKRTFSNGANEQELAGMTMQEREEYREWIPRYIAILDVFLLNWIYPLTDDMQGRVAETVASHAAILRQGRFKPLWKQLHVSATMRDVLRRSVGG
jgi:hypothetical protein